MYIHMKNDHCCVLTTSRNSSNLSFSIHTLLRCLGKSFGAKTDSQDPSLSKITTRLTINLPRSHTSSIVAFPRTPKLGMIPNECWRYSKAQMTLRLCSCIVSMIDDCILSVQRTWVSNCIMGEYLFSWMGQTANGHHSGDHNRDSNHEPPMCNSVALSLTLSKIRNCRVGCPYLAVFLHSHPLSLTGYVTMNFWFYARQLG